MEFPNLTLDEVRTLVSDNLPESFVSNQNFYEGDHWQSGVGWVGPQPSVGEEGYATVMSEIERAFTTQNVIAEIVDRMASGLLGREPDWNMIPLKVTGPVEGSNLLTVDELEETLIDHWDSVNSLLVLEEAYSMALLHGRALLRVYIPPQVKSEEGLVATSDFQASLKKIHIHTVLPRDGLVYQDPDTLEKMSIYLYTKDEVEYAELSYIDQVTGRTIWQTISKDGIDNQVNLEMGGLLMMYQIEARKLITEPVRGSQKQLNKAKTMMGRNTDLAGFVERTILNGQMPGEWVTDANGKNVFIPEPLRVGPGTTNYIVGEQYTDAEGKTQVLNPSIVYRDPVTPQPFIETIREAYLAILREARQLHAAITTDSNIGFDSRRQAMGDYVDLLRSHKKYVDAMGRWYVGMLVSLGSAFSKASYGKLYRIHFDAIIHLGTLSEGDQKMVLERQAAGLLSDYSAMVALGTEDPDAEKALIQKEKKAKDKANTSLGGELLKNFMNRQSVLPEDDEPDQEPEDGE